LKIQFNEGGNSMDNIQGQDHAEAVAQFVRETIREQGSFFYLRQDVKAHMYGLVQEVGFRVSGFRLAQSSELETKPQDFPVDPMLPFVFFSQYGEDVQAAAGWLDMAMKAARTAVSLEKSAVEAIKTAVQNAREMEPIQLTLHGDRLVVWGKHVVNHGRSGFSYCPEFRHSDEMLPPIYVGNHENCNGTMRRVHGPRGWGRIACVNCYLSIVFHDNAGLTYDGLREDIRSRVLGMPSAGDGPVHVPYPSAKVRPSIES
jgi:hypothetical protein